MATREEYIAAAKALADEAQQYIAQIPHAFQQFVHMDQVGKIINEAAVKAVDAAEQARSVAAKPQ
jgi:uncharacterized coiled-coil DUF342 family protein